MLLLYLDSISFKSRAFNINEFILTLPKEMLPEIDRLFLTEIDSKLSDKQSWEKEVDDKSKH